MVTIKKVAVVFVFMGILGVSLVAQSVEDNWNDFIHYVKIGRFDLAQGYGQALIESDPDPLELLELSQENVKGYQYLVHVQQKGKNGQIVEITSDILDIIEKGRFEKRSDPAIIGEEIRRLSTTSRGYLKAVKRLQNAGEYAVMYMLDALADTTRKEEFASIVKALPQIGQPAIRPLVASLQTDNVAVKAEIVKALGKIGYPQSVPYLKYVAENDASMELRDMAEQSLRQIDPDMLAVPAARLFYHLAENYFDHVESLAAAKDANFANIWFWDEQQQRLRREKVDHAYFNELMAMRCCEWALKADPAFSHAIGLWLAAFCKAEATGVSMPDYFGPDHPSAMVYARTAGPEYVHQGLARAIKDNNPHIAFCMVQALSHTAGEKSLMYQVGLDQPIVQALQFDNRAVRYMAAIAIASANPRQPFPESRLVTEMLGQILARSESEPQLLWQADSADRYALRVAHAIFKLAQTRNPVIDLNLIQDTIIQATKDKEPQIQVLAADTLARLKSPAAQRAIADMAFHADNAMQVRLAAFEALTQSAKINTNLLDDDRIDMIYSLISSDQTDDAIQKAAAAVYGALNLPSTKAKDLILDQSKS